jgi:hypothetical protein
MHTAADFVETTTTAAPVVLPHAAEQRIAQVVAMGEDGLSATLTLDGGVADAAVAVSCLVRPMVDDLVLVLREGSRNYVLGVLERPGANWAVVALPGRGNMSIEGETLALSVTQRMSLRAQSIDLQAKLLTVLADTSSWIGKLYTLIADRFRLSSQTHETSADTLTVQAVDRFAIVDRVDSLKTNTQVVKVEGIAAESAHSRTITVTEDLRMDGKRVTVA